MCVRERERDSQEKREIGKETERKCVCVCKRERELVKKNKLNDEIVHLRQKLKKCFDDLICPFLSHPSLHCPNV